MNRTQYALHQTLENELYMSRKCHCNAERYQFSTVLC